jgi:predicted nucleic acid-binding protein
LPKGWAWLDAIAGRLDDDFVEAVDERPAEQKRPYDVLIAGQAKARNLTLVSHNTDEFGRVPGLRLTDWQG